LGAQPESPSQGYRRLSCGDHQWSPGDTHVGGAYSYLAVGQSTAFNGIQGRREGNLHFAGEHTSLDFQGYMEGALRSGYRAAGEVALPGR
jgi:monoamine oxidase